MENASVSEQVILKSAREVFMEKGMDGARMQEIADRAGINKAMLHYYFRSKEKLFNKVFTEAFKEFWPGVEGAMTLQSPYKAIETIVELYIQSFTEQPFLPNFILTEIHRNPDRIGALITEIGISPKVLITYLEKLMDEGYLKKTNPVEMLVNLISLCIFPFTARPLMIRILMNNEPETWDGFMKGRKKSVMELISACYFLKTE